jgi:phosphohistidine phosphatase
MTSRTLVIMRHAKAEHGGSRSDIDRQLTARGRDDATAAGAWLATSRIAPDLVLCSPAARTRGTWHAVAIGLVDGPVPIAPEVRYEADLYSAGVIAALDLVRGVDDAFRTILLIGHNPTVSALSWRLDDRTRRTDESLRTSGIAVHGVTAGWADCVPAMLASSHTPRA